MSPRPTNSEGNINRAPKRPRKGSTYFGVAILPSSTASQSSPIAAESARASRSRGIRYRDSVAATGTEEISHNSSSVTTLSGDTKPRDAVITMMPGTPGGGSA